MDKEVGDEKKREVRESFLGYVMKYKDLWLGEEIFS